MAIFTPLHIEHAGACLLLLSLLLGVEGILIQRHLLTEVANRRGKGSLTVGGGHIGPSGSTRPP